MQPIRRGYEMNFESDMEHDARLLDTAEIRRILLDRISAILGDLSEYHLPDLKLRLTKRTSPTSPTPYQYEPSLAVVISGRKQVVLGSSAHVHDESLFLLTAVNLPTITHVPQASPEAPYVAMLWSLDLVAAKQLISEMDMDENLSVSGTAMSVGPAGRPLLDIFRRLLELHDDAGDTRILCDLFQREMLYRVFVSPAGARLRQIVRLGTQSNRVVRAVNWLRQNFRAPLHVGELAQISGMGVSTLHHHFRLLTSMSPLQFQKHLRLHEARRILLTEESDAGNAAIQVGYESVTQFNREYRRLFGEPPIRNVRALRSSALQAAAPIGVI
jgi:AraC-like DNA-binding protein